MPSTDERADAQPVPKHVREGGEWLDWNRGETIPLYVVLRIFIRNLYECWSGCGDPSHHHLLLVLAALAPGAVGADQVDVVVAGAHGGLSREWWG